MPDVETRQPTLEEAADWICKSITLEYRRDQMRDWRAKFGDAFADAVALKVKQQWKGKK